MPAAQLLWRIPLAVFGGLLAGLIFPTEGIWILAPLVPAILVFSVLGARFWSGTLIGFHAGLAFYISHIEWMSLYLGPVPLIALATLQALIFAPAMGLLATLWSLVGKRGGGPGVIWFPGIVSIVWTAREFVAISFPYGGFPWSRLAMSQADSIYANWVYWGGLSLLSMVISLIGGFIATALAISRRSPVSVKSRRALWIAGLASIGLATAVPMITPIGNTTKTGEMVIAAVQGNARAGLFANPDRGSILENHVSASDLILTSELSTKPDLIVWPENASDLDPTRYPEAEQQIERVVQKFDAPLTFGTITFRNEKTFNSTLLWLPDQGLVDYYDKKRPVPFAEFVPDREFWALLAPDLIGMVGRDYEFGTREGIFEVAGQPLGTLICFEIAIDDIPRQLVADGAQLILSQTNNADFGYSDETFQQVAIAKLRAIETGRTVINVSTVGKSAMFAPDGSTISELDWYKPGAMVEAVELRSGLTPAMLLGVTPDLVVFLSSMLLAAWAGVSQGKSKPKTRRVRK